MTSRKLLMSNCLVLGTLLCLPAISRAAKFNRVVDIGQKAPAWSGLLGVDDRRHDLADLKAAKVVVVAFWCNHCPVAKAYTPRVIQFTKEFREKGVRVVAISASRFPADRFEKMKARAKQQKYNFAYLRDADQKTAAAYGATCTPHVFVLDQSRRIAYMGRIDDNIETDKVTSRFLRDAVNAVLAGREPEVVESLQKGCEIEFQNR